MPNVISIIAPDLIWPFALAIAWIAGEFGYRLLRIPRLTSYGLVGFLMAAGQLGLLSPSGSMTITLLASISFSLILFELGYRINLHWLRSNPWLGATSLLEAGLTFAAVYAVSIWFGMAVLPALLLASLAMSTSPAVVLRVINEQHSSGQVTERALHLTAFNCVLALFVFKVVLGFWVFEHTGSLGQALLSSLVLLAASAAAGSLFGIAVPGLMRKLKIHGPDATVAYAIAVIMLVSIMHLLAFSPALAALTFGLMVRHRRVALDQAQRNFGALGNLLVVLLFVFVATTIEWHKVVNGAGIAVAIVATRFVTKTIGATAFAHLGGISWRKGMLTGLALTPLSVFALVMLDQSKDIGISLVEDLAALAAMSLILEVFGPIVIQRALIWARETPKSKED
ncbi:cation:proton antiporter [Govanella unica]|uniref:Cation:proton antiporter n=1 Tax=Govanella unica TaxID=2975056 RepID=A0A9X3Z6Z6_9PROT|nr:cation:proton antiporter [Govania unica]MDA5193636.1 cation:proton antiporter [Govania unica]